MTVRETGVSEIWGIRGWVGLGGTCHAGYAAEECCCSDHSEDAWGNDFSARPIC